MASIATRSTQTVDPVSDGNSLCNWLTPAVTKSTATKRQMPGRTAVRWSTGAPPKGNTGWSSKGCSTALTKRAVWRPESKGKSFLPDRRAGAVEGPHPQNISQDMHALTGAAAWRRQPAASPRQPARRLSAGEPPRCGRRRPCRRGRRGLRRGVLRSGPAVTQLRSCHSRLVKPTHGGSALGTTKSHHLPASYIQSETSLRLHITTFRMHSRCSHDVWYHERTSVHFTVARSVRLKAEISYDHHRSSLGLPLLCDLAQGGFRAASSPDTPRPGQKASKEPAADTRRVACSWPRSREKHGVKTATAKVGGWASQ